MTDYISRQAVIEKIEHEYRTWGEEYGVTDVLCDIEDMPSAQPERKKGEWEEEYVKYQDGEYIEYRCPICDYLSVSLWDFCPNCGADMRGEKE